MRIKVAVGIHWMTASIKVKETSFQGNSVSLISASRFARKLVEGVFGAKHPIEPSSGNAFYEYCFRDQVNGAFIQVSTDPMGQGVLVTCPGETCERMDDTQATLKRFIEAGFKMTRIDVAFDVLNCTETVSEWRDQYKARTDKHRKLKENTIDEPHGYSFYLGSRESARMLRVYDKALEQGLAEKWVRVEIELKQYAASNYAAMISDDPAKILHDVLQIMGTPNSRLYLALMEVDVFADYERARAPKAKGNREMWFYHSVMPAFRTLCALDPTIALQVYEAMGQCLVDAADAEETYTLQYVNQ